MTSTRARYRQPRSGQGYHRFHGVPLGGQWRQVYWGRWIGLAVAVAGLVTIVATFR